MKLIVQADDYGMTTGVTDGIVACGRDGILTQTGLFTNMPSSAYAVRRYKEEMPHVLLGQDLNLSTGSPITDPKLIPSLVNEDGTFLTSKQHRQKAKENPHHVTYEDAYLEYDNQVKRFIDLVGCLPGYIGGHAWSSDETQKALNDVREKYGVLDGMHAVEIPNEARLGGWSKPKLTADQSYEYSVDTQLEQDPLQYFKNGQLKYLEDHADDDVIAILHTHAGFLDRDLYKLSSFSAVRPMEAGLICSKELKAFIHKHNIQLVNIKQLV